MGIIVFNQETDDEIPGQTFATVEFTDSGPGRVSFELDLQGILDGADNHTWGFQSDYDGVLAIDPQSFEGATFSVTQDASVPGLGNLTWDYVVSYGNGNPQLDPVTFDLHSVNDTDFDITDVATGPSLVTSGGMETTTALHVQRTNPPGGSETVVSVSQPPNQAVPEPASLAIFGLMLCGLELIKRKRKAR